MGVTKRLKKQLNSIKRLLINSNFSENPCRSASYPKRSEEEMQLFLGERIFLTYLRKNKRLLKWATLYVPMTP